MKDTTYIMMETPRPYFVASSTRGERIGISREPEDRKERRVKEDWV